MGLSAVIPVIHGLRRYGLQQMKDRIGLTWLVLQGLLYVLGAGIYAVSVVGSSIGILQGRPSNTGWQARIPERFEPGRFDILGSSHQIFHVLILFAATAHLLGLIRAYEHAKTALVC